jgi:predicted porin
MGQFAVGADRFVTKATTNLETVSANYGISYAVDKNLSASVNRIRTNTENTSQDETIWQYGVGYNLGPVSVSADYTKVSNMGYSVTENAKMFGLHLATKF